MCFNAIGLVLGVVVAALLTLLLGVYSICPTERGVITTFGRAQRLEGSTAGDPELGGLLTEKKRQRNDYSLIRVIPTERPDFEWRWQPVHKGDLSIEAVSITWAPEVKRSDIGAVTWDNLSVQISGPIRWKPCEFYKRFLFAPFPLLARAGSSRGALKLHPKSLRQRAVEVWRQRLQEGMGASLFGGLHPRPPQRSNGRDQVVCRLSMSRSRPLPVDRTPQKSWKRWSVKARRGIP